MLRAFKVQLKKIFELHQLLLGTPEPANIICSSTRQLAQKDGLVPQDPQLRRCKGARVPSRTSDTQGTQSIQATELLSLYAML
jgi:hypothetical protein